MRCSPTWRRSWSRPTAGSTAAQMIDALGLAETTPGPLILVTQFVGMIAGLEAAGGTGLAARRGRSDALDDLRAVLPVDLRRCAYVEPLLARPRLQGALSADHRRGRRRDPEPLDLVRAACPLLHRFSDGSAPLAARRPGPATLDPDALLSRRAGGHSDARGRALGPLRHGFWRAGARRRRRSR